MSVFCLLCGMFQVFDIGQFLFASAHVLIFFAGLKK